MFFTELNFMNVLLNRIILIKMSDSFQISDMILFIALNLSLEVTLINRLAITVRVWLELVKFHLVDFICDNYLTKMLLFFVSIFLYKIFNWCGYFGGYCIVTQEKKNN